MKKKDLITITYNDLGISWGPAIHYLELWNEFTKKYSNEYNVIGYAPSWTGEKTQSSTQIFPIKQISVPNIPIIRQIIYDLFLCFILIKHRKKLVYLRLSTSFFNFYY